MGRVAYAGLHRPSLLPDHRSLHPGNRTGGSGLSGARPVGSRVSFAHLLLLVPRRPRCLLPPRRGPIRAARTTEAPKIDGRPDDPVWQLAPPFTQFLEQFPDEGPGPGAQAPHRGPGAPRRPDPLHPGDLPRPRARARPASARPTGHGPRGRHRGDRHRLHPRPAQRLLLRGERGGNAPRRPVLRGRQPRGHLGRGLGRGGGLGSRKGGAPSSPSRSTS